MVRKIQKSISKLLVTNGKLRICHLLLVAVFILPACTPVDDTFDIQKITGEWACAEKSNSEGSELLNYRITINSTGTNTCTIRNFMNTGITVPATVSETWSITIPPYVKGSYTYRGTGNVNIQKMTISLYMWSEAGSTSENIHAECERPK